MILLRLIGWPYARKHLLRTLLTTTGIVLGVGVFVGMHTANESVLFGFSQTIDRIAGRTDLQVTAGETGFGEEVLESVQAAPTVGVAVPVIEAIVESGLPGQGDLLILGVDMTGDRSLRDYDLDSGEDAIIDDPLVFLAQPDSLIVSKDLADRHRLGIGSRLPLQTAVGAKPFTIRGIMQPSGLASAFGGNLAIMDVYAAQQMFGRGRTFDRIDLAVAPGGDVGEVQRELATLLGPGFEVQPPAARGQQAQAMVAGYTMMVNISSAFALFIGMFIIYSSFATAVAQRRSEIGVLRALGASRGQIRALFLTEGLVLGLFGSIVGLGVGVVIARVMATAISALVGEAYGVAQQAAEVATNPLVLGFSLMTGVATSLVAATIPAIAAARVDPVHALKKGSGQTFSPAEHRTRMIVAAGLGILAAGALFGSAYRPVFFAGYAFTIALAVLLCPVVSLLVSKLLRPVLKWLRPVEGALVADSFIQAPRRTSPSVAALMLSLALVVAFAGMARASYSSIVEWIDTTLNPDLFVMPSQRLDLRTTRFPATMAPEIAALPGVQRVHMFRNNRITFRGAPAMAVAIEMERVRETARTKPVGGNAAEMYRLAAAGEGVIVSDNLAQLHRLALGEQIEIPAPYGAIRLPIVGIIVDFTSQQGAVLMDRSLFIKYWRDDGVSDFHVFATPGTSILDVRQRIIDLYADRRHVFVLTNEESRRYILGVADQWFGLMDIQIAVAVFVAILGIVNTLTVSIADRRRELGVLQAIGGLKSQIRRTIWLEASTVAVLGLIVGCAFGAVNLYYLLQIVQRDTVGLRLDYEFPVMTVLALVPIMLVAGFIAALWPAESAVRMSLVEALEYE